MLVTRHLSRLGRHFSCTCAVLAYLEHCLFIYNAYIVNNFMGQSNTVNNKWAQESTAVNG